jgi:hypothetical protein
MPVTLLQAQTILSGALVLFTGDLMVVTVLYWIETQNHTTEMRKSRQETQKHTAALRTANEEAQRHTAEMQKNREAEFRPVLKPTIEWSNGLYLFFEFENIGKGAAKDVDAEWGFKHLDHHEEWGSPLVTDGQRFTFKMPFEDANTFYSKNGLEQELGDADGILEFEARYRDVFDNEYTVEEEVDVIAPVATRADKELVQREELSKIRRELKKTRKETKKIRKEFEDANKLLEAVHDGEDEP